MNTCQCSDPGCHAHPGTPNCERPATITLYRVDMTDYSGTDFCDDCAADALESGLFSDEPAESPVTWTPDGLQHVFASPDAPVQTSMF